VIEAALDLGHVVAGKQKEEICELELELREGDPAPSWNWPPSWPPPWR